MLVKLIFRCVVELRRRLFFCICVVATLQLNGCAIVHHYEAIEGKVVDLETGEPISGAAVHASYYTTFYNMIEPTSWYLNSQETLSDDKGEFVIPSQLAFAFRPMNLFDEYVDITIFKPGFGCYGSGNLGRTPKVLKGNLKPGKESLVGLPRLMTREERRLNASCTPADGDYPKLLDLLNFERIEIGIPPLSEPK